jgi:hypothetical protein
VSDSQDLRALRKRIGSQAKVGELLGITGRTVGTYERHPERAPAWYRLALLGLAEKTNPELAAPGSPTDPTL